MYVALSDFADFVDSSDFADFVDFADTADFADFLEDPADFASSGRDSYLRNCESLALTDPIASKDIIQSMLKSLVETQ